jgi:hypothetical protein
MMKLPMQVAPVPRNFGTARYAMSSGIKPSENLCSCHYQFPGCAQDWNNCPSDYPDQICQLGVGACLCYCCDKRFSGAGTCIGPYQ